MSTDNHTQGLQTSPRPSMGPSETSTDLSFLSTGPDEVLSFLSTGER